MSSFELRKEYFADERDDNLNEIGKPTIRQDIEGHVTGRSRFFDDHLFEGLLHMRCVRSPHHHARIRSVDTSAAERMEGVRRIVRPADVPVNLNTLFSLMGLGRDDEEVLATQKVAYIGHPLLAIIADTERQARDAVAAVRVDWEVLPHVLTVEDALKPGAPVVNDVYPNNTFDYHELYDHQKLRFGDVTTAMAQADHIVEGNYSMSPIEQAPMETNGALAAPEGGGRYLVHTPAQALFFSLGTSAKLMDMPSSKLHFVGGTAGGGFGGKVDGQHEPLAILGVKLTGKPVRYIYDRSEEMQVGGPRGAEQWHIRDGVMRDGRIVAREFTGFFDSGAYTRLSSYAPMKGTGHLPGPYTIPNVASNVYCVYTNRTPSTAMRGFGITGVDFAIEAHMDKVAETVGMNPVELRILNAYRDGDMKAHRRYAKNCALIECCQVVAQKAGITISAQAAQAKSMEGGGVGWRGEVPETVTDDMGRIGDRKQREIPTEPFGGATSTGRIPAGTMNLADVAAEVQDPDMAMEPARIGHRVKTPASAPAPATVLPTAPAMPVSTLQVPPPATSTSPVQPPPVVAPAPPQAAQSVQPTQPASRPDAPRRPRFSQFVSGTRRR